MRIIILPLLLLVSATLCSAQSRVAVVDTSVFPDARKGITRLVRALEGVEREFEPRRAELAEMHERVRTQIEAFSFAGPIPTDPEPVTPERRKRMKTEAEEMQRLVDERQAAFERARDRRVRDVTAPIERDIRASLEAFARARGIELLLDANGVSCLVGCETQSAAGIDITQDFIAEYNRLNP